MKKTGDKEASSIVLSTVKRDNEVLKDCVTRLELHGSGIVVKGLVWT